MVSGTCTIYENDSVKLLAEGRPEQRVCFLPAAQCEVLDTWYTTGLRGSGSNDFAIKDVFVPEERSAAFPFRPVRPGPLYAFPMMFAYNLPGVTLGIARGAIDTFVELAARKATTMSTAAGRPVMLRDETYAQMAISRAEGAGRLRPRLYLREMGDIWRTLLAGERVSIQQRARYRIALARAQAAVSKRSKDSTRLSAERRSMSRGRSIGLYATSNDQSAYDGFTRRCGEHRQNLARPRRARLRCIIAPRIATSRPERRSASIAVDGRERRHPNAPSAVIGIEVVLARAWRSARSACSTAACVSARGRG